MPFLCEQALILLLALTFNLKNNNLDLVDLSKFDIMNISIVPHEISDQLIQILNIDKLGDYLFEVLDVPINNPTTSKGKSCVIKGIFTVFFLSNFTPDQKCIQFFYSSLDSFYTQNGLNLEIDYRFSLISHLSAFNIRTETNHYEVGNGTFHSEVIIGRGMNALKYTCEDDSMKYAKKEVWHIAYNSLVLSVQEFFLLPMKTGRRNQYCSSSRKYVVPMIYQIHSSHVMDY